MFGGLTHQNDSECFLFRSRIACLEIEVDVRNTLFEEGWSWTQILAASMTLHNVFVIHHLPFDGMMYFPTELQPFDSSLKGRPHPSSDFEMTIDSG